MKIQTALIINALASLLLIVVWVPFSNVARESFNGTILQQERAKEFLLDAIDLNEAVRSYIIAPELQTYDELNRRNDIASIHLIPQNFVGSAEKIIFDSLVATSSDLTESIQKLRVYQNTEVISVELADEYQLEVVQASELANELIEEAVLLFDLKQTQLNEVSQGIDLTRTITILGGFITLTLINFLIYRAVTIPVRKLTTIASKISEGQVHAKMTTDDLPKFGEFAELSDAFVKMTSKLDEYYVDLQTKVEDRTKALSDTLEDIEDKKEEYEKQVLETEKFKQAVDSSTDGILILKVDGEIVYANIAWGKITGYTANELVSKNIRILQNKKQDEHIYSKIWSGMINVKEIVIEELVNKRKDGDYYQAQIAVYPINEEGQARYYVCVQQDITKRKEIDRAKTEFVSLASHQLRTPLSTIGWYAEMLMAGDAGELNEEQQDLLNEIVSGNKRMVELVNALLNVSRIELGTFSVEAKWTNIIEISESVINELAHITEERQHEIQTDYDLRLPDIKTDPNLMRIIFQNLISNALKYTPKGGKVNVRIRGDLPTDNDKPDIGFSNIVIEVEDNGMGIPGRQQDQVFTKLFRADNVKETDTEGTGLGLYLVKSIVDYAGGIISFNSKENEGTKFVIKLPISGMGSKDGTREIITEIARTSTENKSLISNGTSQS